MPAKTIAPRLHGRCPACSRVEVLRPNGTLSQHRAPRGGACSYLHRPGFCGGAGEPPVPGSIAEWLTAEDAAAEVRLARAVTALEAARVAREEATTHLGEWRAWAEKHRVKLAKAVEA